jgi:hypothetical protein
VNLLRIENHGPLILSSNYWSSDAAGAGKLYLSTNAGAFRLLVPAHLEPAVSEMATGKVAVVSRGPWPEKRLADALEILLDDGTENPWCCHLDANSVDRMPLDSDAGKEWVFTVWTRPRRKGSRPHKALERVAYYRRVESLPWLKPYTPEGTT